MLITRRDCRKLAFIATSVASFGFLGLRAKADEQPATPAKQKAQKEAASDQRYRSLESLARGLFYIETMYVDPTKVKSDKLVADALKGVVSQLDPHTMYIPGKAFEQFTSDTQGKFGGVGIIVSTEQGKLVVVSPIEDSPAARAGVKSGDEIIAIDDTPIEKLKGGDATDLMRGKPDSSVKITIKRKSEAKPLVFKLVREIIKVKSVRGQELGDDILYARISSFQDATSDELEALLSARKGKTKGLILDLRDNPGGLLDQATKVSDLFIESGIIVSTVGRDPNSIEREYAHKRGTYSDFPIVTLINGGSASASEIVAGALQDHERSMILGTTSFGKGSVQTLISLPDKAGLKITIARYYTPKDRSIQAKGIEPDIWVDEKKDASAPTPVEDAKTNPADRKKERDLKGHIDSKDLSDLAKQDGMLQAMKNWPEGTRKDNQLVTAYSYLRGWAVFQKRPKAERQPAKFKTKMGNGNPLKRSL